VKEFAMSFYQEHVVPHLVKLAMRNRELEPYRERVIAGAEGRVLEIGIGAGANLKCYPASVKEIIGLEPSARLISMARHAAAQSADRIAAVNFMEASAEAIPLEPGTVDTVVMTWTLCSIPAPLQALREMRRVLKPGGVFAAWTYADCHTSDAAINAIKNRLYIDLTGPYWPPERAFVDAGYRTLPFPFVEIAAPEFAMIAQWDIEHFLAYLRTWSASQRYLKAKGEDPVALIEPQLRAAWRARVREVRWRFHLRVGRI